MTISELAIVNARIRTGDPSRPWADAILLRGDRVAAVGSSAEIRKRAIDTITVDGRGMTIEPEDIAEAPRPPGADAPPVMLREGMPASLVMRDRATSDEEKTPGGDVRIVLAISAGRVVQDRDGLIARR